MLSPHMCKRQSPDNAKLSPAVTDKYIDDYTPTNKTFA